MEKKKLVRNIMVYGAAVTTATTLGVSMCKWGNVPVLIFNNQETMYSNDVITYSSLNHTITTTEKEDTTNLDCLNNNLSLYSEWIELSDYNWERTITTFEVSQEALSQMEDFVLRNASEEEWQNMINSLEVKETIPETLVGEPVIKDKYFEFQRVDDTSYRVPATTGKQLFGIFGILIFNVASCWGIAHEILSMIDKRNKQEVDSQKVKSINK